MAVSPGTLMIEDHGLQALRPCELPAEGAS